MEILQVGAFGSTRLIKTNEGEFAEKLMIIKEKDRFEQEIQSLLRVSHPNIVRHVCYYFEETSSGSRTIIRTQFHPRGTLDKLIHESPFIYSVATVIEWAAELFAALSYLVTVSIVYKNIKPSNVLLSQDFQLKLCNFGFGKDFLEDLMNTPNAGLAAYMSPEVNGYGNPDKRSIITTASDVYAVGIVLWEIVERRRIFSTTRRKMDGFGIRSSLGQGELTVPLVEANRQIVDFIHSSTMIDRHQRPSPADLFKNVTGMKKWDIYEKYSIEPILTGENTTDRPSGIKEEPRFCEAMDNDYEVCKRNERLPQRGCSRNSAFKNKEKYSSWKEKRSIASPMNTSLDDRGKWRKMSENDYEMTRVQKEREGFEEVKWRRPEPIDEPISPSEDEGPNRSAIDSIGYSRLANFTSVVPSEGFYETIEDLPTTSGIQKQSTNRQSKALINLSQINNLAATSFELNGSTDEWMVRIEKLKSTPRYRVAQLSFYEKNEQQIVEIDSKIYEDFIRISDAAWKKQRNSYSYQIMQMMVMNLEKKQLLPLIKKLCLNEYYSRAAWCTCFCIERFSIVDINWLGIADCLFRIILRELIEQNIASETDPQIEKQVTRYIIIHHRVERLTKNEEIRQIWKIARFLLNFDISRYGSENESEFREVYLNVLKKLANDSKNDSKKKSGLSKDLVEALEVDIEQMKEQGPSFDERKFCIALWSLPIGTSSRNSF